MVISLSKGSAVRTSSLLCSAAVIAALTTGCSSAEDDSVRPKIEVLNRTASALSAEAVTAINGTYGVDCDGRASDGTDPWTFVIGDANASTLTVRKNDANCALTITSLVADGTFIATPAITLGTTWQATASAFAEEGEATEFYGNAMISSTAFSDDPTISVIVSDSPNVSDAGEKEADFAVQSASFDLDTVAAPNYTISFSGFSLEKDVNSVVQSVSGHAQLAEDSVAGQDYAIHLGELTSASSLGAIEAAYAGAASTGPLSALTSLEIPATEFGLMSPAVDLDGGVKRTVIIRNTTEGVSAYQLLVVTFTP